MQIIEHQDIHLSNLISYSKQIKHSDILKLIRYISDNLHTLDLNQSDRILFTENGQNKEDDIVNAEILIPVTGTVVKCNEFQYKPIFRLVNAISIRHEGSLTQLSETENILEDFIRNKKYEPITPPYYVIIRNDGDSSVNCIIDIYIGINYNLL